MELPDEEILTYRSMRAAWSETGIQSGAKQGVSINVKRAYTFAEMPNLTADGTYYAFELITLKNKRQYFYTNPEDKLKDFDINNVELVRINRMINLLNTQLNLKESDRKKCPVLVDD